jgi:hypothetical protein
VPCPLGQGSAAALATNPLAGLGASPGSAVRQRWHHVPGIPAPQPFGHSCRRLAAFRATARALLVMNAGAGMGEDFTEAPSRSCGPGRALTHHGHPAHFSLSGSPQPRQVTFGFFLLTARVLRSG